MNLMGGTSLDGIDAAMLTTGVRAPPTGGEVRRPTSGVRR